MTGSQLRRLREEIGLTQGQLGERLGIPEKTIQRWETGTLQMRHPGLIRLALAQLREHPEQPPTRSWENARIV